MSYLLKLRTLQRLGVGNLVRVAWYRLGLKAGISPVVRAKAEPVSSGVFFPAFSNRDLPEGFAQALRWNSGHYAFGVKQNDSLSLPDWHVSLINGQRAAGSDEPWWTLPDFDSSLGDIKGVWEASRFDWVVGFSMLASAGDVSAKNRLQVWLSDWVASNPAYLGVNWKCGQEASIRVMHLALAHQLSGAERVSQPLNELLLTHLRRIAPTTSYAKAQDNNHGTSEAGGLYIGGLLLVEAGEREGWRYIKQGRELLEDRVTKLIARDGSFSQHSLNYHRLMLDTLSLVEIWRRKYKQPRFSPVFNQRAKAATLWLYEMQDSLVGDAPVLGANDGAELLVLHGADYRDHRPSVHLAANLFLAKMAFKDLPGCAVMADCLGLESSEEELCSTAMSVDFRDGGYSLLRNAYAKVLFNVPRYRFRPIQSDALHVDLWADGKNILRDGGTFSYNTSPELVDYFSGTASHNTIQFDHRDQMRKLSRFLFADWLVPTEVIAPQHSGPSKARAEAGYMDYQGAVHHRSVELDGKTLTVTDEVSGVFSEATLRWRVIDADWVLDGNVLTSSVMHLEVNSCGNQVFFALEKGHESRYYGEMCDLMVLECVVETACTLTTRITLR